MGNTSGNPRRKRPVRSAGAVVGAVEAVVRAVVDFALPDVCCLCGARTGTTAPHLGLNPATRCLAGRATVPVFGPLAVVNHPFCAACLSEFEPSREPGHLGSCGAWGGKGWVRAGRAEPLVHDASRRIPGAAPPEPVGSHDLRVYSPFRTNDAILELVRLVKFVRRRSLLQLAAAAMAAEFRRRLEPQGGWVLVPVPMHPSARRRRGFNQAEVLADGVARLTGTPVVAAVGKRVKTRPQSLTASADRMDNVRGVFQSTGRRLDGCAACLVDDLVTTGATAASCAAVALSAGARKVAILSLAQSS
ncbi:MAG: hypothetical protein PVF33_03290 [Candidatus Latescibacterota bacterium]